MSQAILTVIGKDKPGIIAKVTGILFKTGCNLEDISMSVLQGEFAMIMIVDAPKSQLKGIKQSVSTAAKRWHLAIDWKSAVKKLKRGEKHEKGTVPYLVSIYGKDRHGIVYQTSALLAKNQLNITDLNCKILGQGQKTVYLMLLEVDIPHSFSIPLLRGALDRLARKLKVSIALKPVDKIEL